MYLIANIHCLSNGDVKYIQEFKMRDFSGAFASSIVTGKWPGKEKKD